jgi:polar amino acid transport system substrate-binding protein
MGHGEVDGAFSASFVPDRLDSGVYPTDKGGHPDVRRSLMTAVYQLYKLRTSTITWNGSGFGGLDGPIGALQSTSIVYQLRTAGAEVQEVAGDHRILIRMLAQGFVPAVALFDQVGDQMLKQDPELALRIEKVSPPLVEKPYFLMLSHQFVEAHKDLADQVWAAIASERDSADYKAAAAAYLMRPAD